MTLNFETLTALRTIEKTKTEADGKMARVITAEVGHFPATAADACKLIKRVIADSRFPWVSITDSNCCGAVHSYQENNFDSAAYQAIEMLGSRFA